MRSTDPTRLPPDEAERWGHRTIASIMGGLAVLSFVGVGVAVLSFMQCTRTFDRIAAGPTCAQCQRADPRAVLVRGTDTIGSIVELATLPPERFGEDSLFFYRARLRRGQAVDPNTVVAVGGPRGPLELRPRDSAGGVIVGRLFIEGVDHPVAVRVP